MFPYRNNSYEQGAQPPVRYQAGTGAAEAAFYNGIPHRSGKQQLEGIIDLLYRRRWMLAVSFLVMVTVAAAYTFTQEPFYQAKSYIMVDLEKGSTAGVPGEDGSLFASNDRPLSDELFVLENSVPLAQQVAERIRQLQVVPGSDTPLSILQGEDGQPLALEQVMVRLSNHIAFAAVHGSENIVEITATSAIPGEAVLIANLYAEEYVQLTQEARSARLSRSGEFLQEQLEMRREELQQAEVQLGEYVRAEKTEGLSQEESYLVSKIAELEAEQEDARIQLQLRRTTLTSLEQELAGTSPQLARHIVSDLDRKIQDVRAKIAELENQKEAIQLRYPNEGQRSERTNNALREIDRQVQQLQGEAEHLAEQYVSEGSVGLSNVASLNQQILQERSAIEELEATIDVVGDRLEQYRATLRGLPAQSLELAQLERAHMYAERMHQLVEERLLDTRLAGELQQGTGYVRVVREASMGMPVQLDLVQNLILGTFLGLLLGLGLAVLRDKLDNRIYKPDQLRAQGYSEIGVIPNMQPLIKEDYKGKAFVDQNGRQVATSLIALHKPTSAIAEAYRSLRTNIQFSIPDTPIRTLLVTSPGAGEGKSVTAANLAVSLARAGRRILLIDADLRRPQLHKLFGLQQDEGLVELLLKETGFDVEKARIGIENLYIITAGRTRRIIKNGHGGEMQQVISSDEVLGSKRMQGFLSELKNQFDLLILDTPPVLAAADAAILSTQCDATMVVMRAGVTKEGELDYTIEALSGVGATIIGVLLNGFDLAMAYGHKYRYQRYSKYGHYSKYGYYG